MVVTGCASLDPWLEVCLGYNGEGSQTLSHAEAMQRRPGPMLAPLGDNSGRSASNSAVGDAAAGRQLLSVLGSLNDATAAARPRTQRERL